jgi:site-specific recombinase XerD
MVYRRGRKWTIPVPLRSGGFEGVASGTTDRPTAERVEAMVKRLAARKDWQLLETVTGADTKRDRRAKTKALNALFAADEYNQLDDYRARATEPDLSDYVEPWRRDDLAPRFRSGSREVDRRVRVVRTLIPEGARYPASRLTPDAVKRWQALPPAVPAKASQGGRRLQQLRRSALGSFCQYLVEVGVLAYNPVRSVRGPGKIDPRMRFLDEDERRALVDAQSGAFRVLSALIHGTGLEIGSERGTGGALKLRRRDLIPAEQGLRARGTKNRWRDRAVYVEPWAWAIVWDHAKRLTPEARLFPPPEAEGEPERALYRAALKSHHAACLSLGIEDYGQHDARHTFAVCALRRGVPPQLVASNLGHRDAREVLERYGRYIPQLTEWRRYERAGEGGR